MRTPLLPAHLSRPRRLCVYNGGLLARGRVRRILELAGWQVALGRPGSDDWVGVWGHSPTAPRGEKVAQWADAPVLRIEDAFLRSVLPGRAGDPPLGLCLDTRGVHYDSSQPSDLEQLLATHPLDDTALLDRARTAIARIRHAHLSKYNAFDLQAPLPDSPYVLVIDQTRDDASILHGGADAGTFHEMLVFAQTEHPGMKVVIKTHPDTAAGHRPGHFGPEDENHRITLLRDPVSPWALFEGAVAVYTVSSQMGFEAIYAGHRPRVFGQPFYAGWGLTQDENPVPRRARKLSRAQLFAAAMILYPHWYDPHFDRLCTLEETIDELEAAARGWREDRAGWVACAISRWKRRHMRAFFGQRKPLILRASPARARRTAAATGRRLMVWATRPEADALPDAVRIEDGFVRSVGLGAELAMPLSLVQDDLGICCDPARESRLDRLISASGALPEACLARARALIETLARDGVSKYNLPHRRTPDLPEGRRILVPGQVEDDASIRLGCPAERSNLDLLARTRAENPDAVILYKPHPDVEAGLRPGALPRAAALEHADMVLEGADPARLAGAVDEVWTLTSLLGFEALIRGTPVTCLGLPFYAGWGLTRDLARPPAHRGGPVSLEGLAHAALIDYPRYFDPFTGAPISPELALRFLDRPAPSARKRRLAVALMRARRRFRTG